MSRDGGVWLKRVLEAFSPLPSYKYKENEEGKGAEESAWQCKQSESREGG